jgi:hypothetical protein
MIKPTVGRVVWYTPAKHSPWDGHQPLAAIITHVHSDAMVNLTVFNPDGDSHGVCSVDLIQDGQPRSDNGRYCEWMPYQKGQAAKTEQLEQKLSGSQ